MASSLALFFKGEIATLAAIEIGHLGKGFLQALKKVQHRLPTPWQVHLGLQETAHCEVIALRAVSGHGCSSFMCVPIRSIQFTPCNARPPVKMGHKLPNSYLKIHVKS